MWGGQGSDAQMWILETGHAQPTAETNVVASTNTTAASQKEEQDADITVMGWLVKLGVERYKRAFIRAEIDWISLLELTDNDLKLMGVHQLGPRKKILMAIDSLRSAHRKTLSVADDLFQRRYRVGREIVFGGVPCKRAVDITTDGPVVLKFIPDVVAFRREVAALNELRSEFVADLLEFYEDPLGGRSCLVLEYSQFSLDRLFEKRRLQPNERKALFERMTRLVRHFHDLNFVITNLRPDIICLFGTKWKIANVDSVCRTGSVVGFTGVPPLYCSPEYARAILRNHVRSFAASPSADMWALGGLLVDMFLCPDTFFEFRVKFGSMSVLEQLQTFSNVPLPQLDDPQALHLLSKLLVKTLTDRVTPQSVLRHAYLVGGLDTEQLAGAFNILQTKQKRMFGQLATVISSLQPQPDRDPATK
eukprot:c11061_g1_i2.p1 GENE.c11061_g1_i2~~c11061_g1_i2.p1  ORF type:complete len:420 (-),score=115.01 c11061_g1_i2:86-1345(-)